MKKRVISFVVVLAMLLSLLLTTFVELSVSASDGFEGAGDCIEHVYENGVCTACGEVCPHIEYVDRVCTVCGVKDIVYGDANGDGKININDTILVNQYLANYDYDTGESSISVSAGADANGDAKININDTILINQYLANYDYDNGSSTVVLGPSK